MTTITLEKTQIEEKSLSFVDLKELSFEQAARRIYEDKTDILVDLMGHTKDNRMEICAFRPAPIQVTWLGFPGTTGVDFFDYIIMDKITSPPENATVSIRTIPNFFQLIRAHIIFR